MNNESKLLPWNTHMERTMCKWSVVFVVSAAALLGADGAMAQPITPEMSFQCTPTDILAFRDRVHIRCSATERCPPSGPFGQLCRPAFNPVDPAIVFYATENIASPNALAITALTIAGQAIATGRGLSIHYRSSSTENPAGCLAGDCRRLVGVILVP